MSDSTVKDKFTELAKALSEQLVDFLMVCNRQHTVCFVALPPAPEVCTVGSHALSQIRRITSVHHTFGFLFSTKF